MYKSYFDQFTLAHYGLDVSFVGLEKTDDSARAYHLFPYQTVDADKPLGFKGTKLRISIIDKALRKLKSL